MYYFCTYFDQHYLSRGLALYRSLKERCGPFRLWILCLDRLCYETLARMALPDISLVSLQDFEANDPGLLQAKQNRSVVEYYFTCTPSLPLFLLKKYQEIDIITYVDADLFFFANPKPIYDEMAAYSIAIIEHRFPPHLRYLEIHGIYNVGWLSFRRDANAMACLEWWRAQCLLWCYDRCEEGRFADQKYLDCWPTRFSGVVVLRHQGANLAPWNLGNYTIHKTHHRLWVDDQPLLFFHFHGLKQKSARVYDINMAAYRVCPSNLVLREIYETYITTLLSMKRSGEISVGSLRASERALPQTSSLWQRLLQQWKNFRWNCHNILARNYVLVIHKHILIVSKRN